MLIYVHPTRSLGKWTAVGPRTNSGGAMFVSVHDNGQSYAGAASTFPYLDLGELVSRERLPDNVRKVFEEFEATFPPDAVLTEPSDECLVGKDGACEEKNRGTFEPNADRLEWNRLLREANAMKLLDKYPDVTLWRGPYSIEAFRYTPYYFLGEIKILTRTVAIIAGDRVPNLDSCFLTKEAAKQAVEKLLPAAQEKYEKCVAALCELEESLDFEVSYVVEGDTHGVEDHATIEFKMEGIEFTFER